MASTLFGRVGRRHGKPPNGVGGGWGVFVLRVPLFLAVQREARRKFVSDRGDPQNDGVSFWFPFNPTKEGTLTQKDTHTVPILLNPT